MTVGFNTTYTAGSLIPQPFNVLDSWMATMIVDLTSGWTQEFLYRLLEEFPSAYSITPRRVIDETIQELANDLSILGTTLRTNPNMQHRLKMLNEFFDFFLGEIYNTFPDNTPVSIKDIQKYVASFIDYAFMMFFGSVSFASTNQSLKNATANYRDLYRELVKYVNHHSFVMQFDLGDDPAPSAVRKLAQEIYDKNPPFVSLKTMFLDPENLSNRVVLALSSATMGIPCNQPNLRFSQYTTVCGIDLYYALKPQTSLSSQTLWIKIDSELPANHMHIYTKISGFPDMYKCTRDSCGDTLPIARHHPALLG